MITTRTRRGAWRRLWIAFAAALLLSAAGTGGAIVLGTAPAGAVQPDEVLDDPELEARARKLSEGLRCMVCQNQSIDDSDAELARDLRLLVRERLTAGDSDAEVRDYLVDRYGEFVLLNPRLSMHTLLLWFGAPAALLAGAGLMVLAYRRRTRHADEAPDAEPLDAREEAELKRILEEGKA